MTRAEEVAVYRLLGVPGVGERALGRVLAEWRREAGLGESFWGRPAAEYRAVWGVSERAALSLQGDGEEGREAAEGEAARARGAEIELLTVGEREYAALAEARGLPPVLFTRGNQDLLWEAGAAIPHSSDAPEAALAWGAALAERLAAAGIGLVSGHNRDGYRRVAVAAKRAGAPLVVALDRPLHGMPAEGPRAEPVATARLWDERFRPERELLVSPLPPGAVWGPRHARGRDALVMATAAVVVAGGVRPGGTIATGCARAGAAGRAVFRSPFCRADLSGTLLPEDVGQAAEVVIETIGNTHAGGPGSSSAPRPTWRERRWAAETAAFVGALEALAGTSARVARRPVTDLTPNGEARREWLDAGIVALIHLPSSTGEEREVVAVIRQEPGRGTGETPALLLAPGEPLQEVEALRGYLARCLARVAAAVRTPPPSGGPALGRPPTPAGGPSPG